MQQILLRQSRSISQTNERTNCTTLLNKDFTLQYLLATHNVWNIHTYIFLDVRMIENRASTHARTAKKTNSSVRKNSTEKLTQ